MNLQINRAEKWINGMDSIRFVLALIVVLGHLSITRLFTSPVYTSGFFKMIKLLIGNAFVGVAAVISFFILSGFVIYLPYRDGREINVQDFLLKRYLRIGIPLFSVVILAYLLKLNINAFPLWSLYCELIYYTLFPVILFLIRRYPINYLILAAFVISYLLVFIRGTAFYDLLHQVKTYNGNYWQYGIELTWLLGLPTWLLGLKLAGKTSGKSIEVKKLKIYGFRMLILITAFLCSVARFHLSLSYTLSLNIFSLLAVYWIYLEINYWKRHQAPVFMENAGKWSYSLYICHPFSLLLIPSFLRDNGFVLLPLELLMALLLAYVFYRVIEKPSHIMARKIKFLKKHPPVLES